MQLRGYHQPILCTWHSRRIGLGAPRQNRWQLHRIVTTPHHAGLARIPANSPGAAAAAPAIRLPLFTHARPNVSPKEVAEVTSISDQQVRDMVEEGIFLAVSISDAGTAVRQHLRIVRSSVEAWWLERFLVTNGFEYPVTNSPEITWWRLELRKKRKDVGGRS